MESLAVGLLYSTCEAMARFSDIVRRVREGRTVTVLYRGEPVAEIPAIQRECMTLEQCFDDLARRGIVVPSGQAKEPLRVLERRPGALRRFVGDRNA